MRAITRSPADTSAAAARVAFFVSFWPAGRFRNCVLSRNLTSDASPLSVLMAIVFAAGSTLSMVPMILTYLGAGGACATAGTTTENKPNNAPATKICILIIVYGGKRGPGVTG